MSMTELTAQEFVSRLASSAPVPGGGGAAALTGAIGVALGNMVGSLTIGKKKYAAVEDEVRELKDRSTSLQERLLSMVDRDAEVFEPLSRAYGLPKDTEEQRAEKARVLEEMLRLAAEVPMQIMELCMEALEIVDRFAQIGSRLAVSDAGCAAACCRAALNAASLNVFINTKSMQDRELADKLNEKALTMLRDGNAQADKIFAEVCAQLR